LGYIALWLKLNILGAVCDESCMHGFEAEVGGRHPFIDRNCDTRLC